MSAKKEVKDIRESQVHNIKYLLFNIILVQNDIMASKFLKISNSHMDYSSIHSFIIQCVSPLSVIVSVL